MQPFRMYPVERLEQRFLLAGEPTLTPQQLLAGDTASALAAQVQQSPQIAKGNETSLAVWMDTRTALRQTGFAGPDSGSQIGSMIDIFAARLDANGNVLDTTPIAISQDDYNQTSVQVGWNGQNWLVAWTTQRDQYYSDVQAVRVSPTGIVLDPAPITLGTAETIDYFPAFTVSSDGSNWAVLWKDLDVAEVRWTMVGSLVQPDGTVADVGGKLLREPPANIFIGNADMVFAQDEYFAVWSEYGDNGIDPIVRAQRFSPNLDPLGGVFTIDDYTSTRAIKPSVATDGTDFFVTWSEESNFLYNQVFGVRVSHAGVVLDPAGIQITPQFQDSATYLPDVTFDGTNYVVAYSASGMSFFGDIKARRISPGGALLGSEITVSASANHEDQPSITPRPGGGTQVVFRDGTGTFFNDGDVRGASISASGVVSAVVDVSTGAPRQTRPQLAFDGSGYMAVFQSDISGTRRVAAQRLSSSGVAIADPVMLASGATVANPDVAFNGSVFLVTWEENNQIFARRLSATGAVLGAAISVMPGDTPAVAALGDTFLIVDSFESPPEIRRIYGSSVSAAGTVLETTLVGGGNFALDPDVAAVGNRWLVAWEAHPTHDNPNATVSARFVNANNTPSDALAISPSGGFGPAIASDGNSALIAFQATTPAGSGLLRDIFGRRVNADNSTSATFSIGSAPGTQEAPAVAWDGTQFLVDWIDMRNYTWPQQDRTDVFGARVSAENVSLDPNGFLIAASIQPEETPTVGAGNGGAVFAYASFQRDVFASFRIATRSIAQAPLTVMNSQFTYQWSNALSFTFNRSVSIDPFDLTLVNTTTNTTIDPANMGVTFDPQTNTATFTFPGLANAMLPDGSYSASLDLDNLENAYQMNFFFLRGDANHDGAVNLADFNVLAANFGQSPRDFTQGDFNYDQVVNLGDFNILASRFGMNIGGSSVTVKALTGGRAHLDRFSDRISDDVELK